MGGVTFHTYYFGRGFFEQQKHCTGRKERQKSAKSERFITSILSLLNFIIFLARQKRRGENGHQLLSEGERTLQVCWCYPGRGGFYGTLCSPHHILAQKALALTYPDERGPFKRKGNGGGRKPAEAHQIIKLLQAFLLFRLCKTAAAPLVFRRKVQSNSWAPKELQIHLNLSRLRSVTLTDE